MLYLDRLLQNCFSWNYSNFRNNDNMVTTKSEIPLSIQLNPILRLNPGYLCLMTGLIFHMRAVFSALSMSCSAVTVYMQFCMLH